MHYHIRQESGATGCLLSDFAIKFCCMEIGKRSISFNGTKASVETNKPNLAISISYLLKIVKDIRMLNERDIFKPVTSNMI